LQLPELVAATPLEFVERACAVVADLPRLAELRAGLRARMRGSSLMNGPKSAASVEAAFRSMLARP
jgi:protein O-GlcNAc transferase